MEDQPHASAEFGVSFKRHISPYAHSPTLTEHDRRRSHLELVRGLIGAQLSVVTFVRSYVQLSFEDGSGTHVLSALNNAIVSDGSDTIRRGDRRGSAH